MEFWYKRHDVDIRIYQDGDGGVWADRYSSDGPLLLTYFVNEFRSSTEADKYIGSVRHEELTKAHKEALIMDAARTSRHTSTKYIVEVLGKISNYDYIACDELHHAMELADWLRERDAHNVRVVKRVTTSEVVG